MLQLSVTAEHGLISPVSAKPPVRIVVESGVHPLPDILEGTLGIEDSPARWRPAWQPSHPCRHHPPSPADALRGGPAVVLVGHPETPRALSATRHQ